MVGPDKTQVGTNAGSTEKKERKKKGCLTHMCMCMHMHMYMCMRMCMQTQNYVTLAQHV